MRVPFFSCMLSICTKGLPGYAVSHFVVHLARSIQAQTPGRPSCPQHLCYLNHFMWLSLWAVGLCLFSTPYQMVPMVKGVKAQQAQPKALCFLTSFDFCPFSLHPSTLSAFHFFTDGQDTNVLLSLCLWNKLRSLEAAVPETLAAWVTFDTRVKI